jgi:starch synthase (maltosyl-transferring)
VELDLEALGLDPRSPYQMHELLSGARYLWNGPRNFVQLAPGMGHVFRLRRRVRTERDFDYFM